MSAKKKSRLDQVLVQRGCFADASEALRAILAGDVKLNGGRVYSAAAPVGDDDCVEFVSQLPYVSRGGFKLAGALDEFAFSVQGMNCLDCGCSTGGFSDCLLQRGAAHVCAVDVGYGQFAWALRCDPRVSLYERCNIRSVENYGHEGPFDLAVSDISFAPIRTWISALASQLKEGGHAILLIKPQFEVAKSLIGEHGVVREASVHAACIEHACLDVLAAGLQPRFLHYSPITGPEGNIEFLLLADKPCADAVLSTQLDFDFCAVVSAAHAFHGLE